MKKMTRELVEKWGGIDILVNNAAINRGDNFATTTDRAWDEVIHTNVDSLFAVTKPIYKQMIRQRKGNILNITSIAVKQPVDGLLLSNSLRAAVTGFARTLANEVASDGITVNNILPGYTRTERVEELARMMAEKQGITAEEFKAKWESEIPMKRLGEPHEFAALAAFLVSERASYITGTSMQVDGGWIRSLL